MTRGDLTETERAILKICKGGPKSNPELLQALSYETLTGNVKKAMQRFTDLRLIEFTIPDKPRSKRQKRKITGLGYVFSMPKMKRDGSFQTEVSNGADASGRQWLRVQPQHVVTIGH